MDTNTINLLAAWYVENVGLLEDEGTVEAETFLALIETWSDEVRGAVRRKLEAWKCPQIVRSLSFNYNTQKWIA